MCTHLQNSNNRQTIFRKDFFGKTIYTSDTIKYPNNCPLETVFELPPQELTRSQVWISLFVEIMDPPEPSWFPSYYNIF